MSVAALVLGICSVALNLVLGCIPIVGPIINIALGVLAIVFAVLGMRKAPEKKGLNITGLVLGIVGAAWALIALIVCGAVLGAAATGLGALKDQVKGLTQ
jgi:hypothetical protein